MDTPPPEDGADRRTEISLELSDTGLKAGTNMRWLSALDRLIGNKLALWGRSSTSKLQIEAAKTEAVVAVIRAGGKAAAEFVQQNPEVAKGILDASFEDYRRPRENKEAVILEARKALEEEPTLQNDTQHTEDQSPETPIDEDWLNFFGRYAEMASSEKMRLLWGRILAGEIRKPGAFTITTLRIASELDTRTATLFQKYARLRFSDGCLLHKLKDKPFASFEELKELQDAGLLTGVDFLGLSLTLGKTQDGLNALAVGTKMLLFDAPNFRLATMVLTRAGREISSFLPVDEDETLAMLIEEVSPASSRVLLKDAYMQDGVWHYKDPTRVLK